MQLVAAIDKQPGMRAVLGLFEGVVTGAADVFGRKRKNRLPHCFILVPVWAMVALIYTMPDALARRSSTLSVIMLLTI